MEDEVRFANENAIVNSEVEEVGHGDDDDDDDDDDDENGLRSLIVGRGCCGGDN